VPASRFHDGQHGTTHIVRPFVFGRELRIVGDNDIVLAVWKLSDIQAAPELDPDGAAALTARHQSGVLLIDDSVELETLRRAGIHLPGDKAWARRHWIGVGAGLAVIVALGILVLTSLPRWVASAIPIAWEQQLGEPAEALATSASKRCPGQEGQAALVRLVERLRAAGGIEMPVTIAVLDQKTINAFTLPGGHVLVLRGLIDETTDGPMLAGVIAHELGHVAHRDSLTLMVRAMGLTILLNSIGLGDPGSGAAAAVSSLTNLAYSRAAEAAADAAAIEFLTKAGLRADGLSRFFVLMEKREAAAGDEAGKQPDHNQSGAMVEWFATHPSSESRREVTARPETGEAPFTEAEWQSIKAVCKKQ
jgi:Zn-dependent protease with chaperone function